MLHFGRILLYSGLLAVLVAGVFVANRPPAQTHCPDPPPPQTEPWEPDRVVSDRPEKPPTPDEIPQLIAQIEALDPDKLFNFHGNDHELVQRLTVLRFDATRAVQDAIDRHEVDPARGKLVEELYGVLGFVKDPDSIPWLKAKLASPHKAAVYKHYMWHWHSGFGPGYGDLYGVGNSPRLHGRDRWIEFFVDLYAGATSKKRRREHVAVLMQFPDPLATAFFEAERRAPREPGIALLVETSLHQRGVAVDAARIAAAIDALSPDEANHGLLYDAAARLRHEAFVPFLIHDFGYSGFLSSSLDAVLVLRNITYAIDVADADGWRAWYAKHKHQTREAWVTEAIEEFEEQLASDPCAAKRVFAKAIYARNDLAALPLARDVLVQRGDFDNEIAGWINLTYTPFNRGRLEPIAEVLVRHPERLSEQARTLLRERGFLAAAPPETWAQHVASANMKV